MSNVSNVQCNAAWSVRGKVATAGEGVESVWNAGSVSSVRSQAVAPRSTILEETSPSITIQKKSENVAFSAIVWLKPLHSVSHLDDQCCLVWNVTDQMSVILNQKPMIPNQVFVMKLLISDCPVKKIVRISSDQSCDCQAWTFIKGSEPEWSLWSSLLNQWSKCQQPSMVLLSRVLKIGSITQVLVPLVLGFKDGVLDLIRLINFCVKLSPFLRFFGKRRV